MAVVDSHGTVELLGSPWRVGWAVGDEDRWHIAAEEAAVRTRLVDDMPVVATAMRVPGGDVVQQAAAVTDGAGRSVVVEYVNKTSAPVSLALAVSGSIRRAGVHGSRLVVGDQIAAELRRVPGGAVAVSDGEVWDAVRSGPPAGDCQASSRAGLAAAAAVLPLARGVPVQVCLPVDRGAEGRGSPGEVVAGWQAVVSRAASVELSDGVAVRAWRRGIAASILAAGASELEVAARAAVVLDRVGLPDEADRAREALVGEAGHARPPPRVATAALRALASRWLRSGRVSGLAELAGPLAAVAGDSLDHLTLEQVAAVLETEAPASARDARRLLAEIRSAPPMAEAAVTTGGLAAAVRNSVRFGGDGLAGVEALLDRLVAEFPDQLVMLPAPLEARKGVSIDARTLATRHGVLSYSVRWHGPRPAVLWDLQPRRDEDPVVTLRCGLDGSWATTARAGEALLVAGPATA